MRENNDEQVVVNNWKEDLKAEGKAQLKAVTNSCMASIKNAALEFVGNVVRRAFDSLINLINTKWFA